MIFPRRCDTIRDDLARVGDEFLANALVIVESPTKARTLKRYLGRKYKVEASGGHVRDLPKSKLGVDIDNEFEPRYITIRGRGKQLESLRKEASKAGKVYLATDPDREGEAISWHLMKALDIDEDSPCRIVFHEITGPAIEEALKSPRPVDHKLVNAQQARRVLDRLVGYNLSPLLWRKIKKGLSAGRVQSVALRLVCDREEEIEAFRPEEYWSIGAVLKTPRGQEFEAKYHGTDGRKRDLPNEEAVNQVMSGLKDQDFTVDKVKKRDRARNPSPPFTTSTMQQEAYRKLSFGVRKTMRVAQQLYEGVEIEGQGNTGLITYMRTDSTRISGTALEQATNYIKERFGKEYSRPRARGKTQQGTQDAHEAVRPTDVTLDPDTLRKDLTRDQFRLYRLIWLRFLASQMSPARMEQVTADITAGRHTFRATGSTIKFPGFLKVYVEGTDDEEPAAGENQLPDLDPGDSLLLIKVEPSQHFTQPPPRFSEASLVKALEESGVGRPSTYAPTVATLLSRSYVAEEDKRLRPTDLGRLVTGLLKEHFPDVVDTAFTAQMEEDLDQIEEGLKEWRGVVGKFFWPFSKVLEKADKAIEKVELPVEELDEQCPKCGRNLVIREGRYGKFIACPGFPDCRYTRPHVEKIGARCPECGKDIVVKRSKKRGRTFYGCEGYPECRFVSWQKPTDKSCPQCGAFMVRRQTKGEGQHLRCSSPSCDHREYPRRASESD